ncbi:MAG TPA: DUF4397 domain-containing protein [Gemmatimonadales bacterium]|jgi:hypothetical protein|nr:DUF4397 domain-containing protein [Gemmatimonadales bacterium]
MRFATLAAGLAALVVLGCAPETVGPRTGDPARLRLASASPDAGTLDLLVNGRTVAQGVGRTAASEPVAIESGSATAEVHASGASAALVRLPVTLDAGKSYTLLVAGPRAALTATMSVDTGGSAPPSLPPPPIPVDSGSSTPNPGLGDVVRFRLMHAAPHAPALDPYLLPAGMPLDTLPTLQPFVYGGLILTADLIRRPGHYVVKFTDAGTTRVVLQSDDIEAAADELITVVLGEDADQSLRVDVIRE